MEIGFKQYLVNDKLDVLEMTTSFNNIEGYHFDPVIREENLLQFTSGASLGRLYLIQQKQQNIGYVVLTFGFSFEYRGRDAFIDEFYIKEKYRNLGIGKMTIDFVASESKKLNIKAIHLEVEPHNENAYKLYSNKGFKSNSRTLLTKTI